MSVRITITLPDDHDADLQSWADRIGDKKAPLAAHLVRVAIERKYPDKHGIAVGSEDDGTDTDKTPALAMDAQAREILDIIYNMYEGMTPREIIIANSIKSDYQSNRAKYAEKVAAFARVNSISWQSAYNLFLSRSAPYNEADIAWAADNPSEISQTDFINNTQ